MPSPTFGTALRRAATLQIVAPAVAWKPRKTERIDPDLPQFLPVPVAMGSRPVWPVPIARPRLDTSSTGSKLVTIVKTFGPGPLQLSNLRLGDEAIVDGRLDAGVEKVIQSASFGEVTYELVEGRVGDGGLDMYAAVIKAETLDTKIKQTTSSGNQHFSIHQSEPDTTRVDIRLLFKGGLSRKVKREGVWVHEAIGAKIEIHLRKQGESSDSNQLFRQLVGADDDQDFPYVISSIPVKGGAGTYAVCVRLYSTGDNSVRDVRWTKLVSRGFKSLGGATGHAVIAVSGDLDRLGGDQFLPDLNADAIPELAETVGGTPVATRNPSAALLDVLQGRGAIHPLADARIDSAAISAWKSACETAGYAFDFTFGADGGRGSTGDALKLIAAAGRARHFVRDGLHSVIREPSGSPLELFTPANMKPGFRVVRNAFGEALHGIRCSFDNREQSFRRETFIVYADGFDSSNATEFEDWSFDGSTSKNAVADLAAYHLEVLTTRGRQYEFAVGKDHLRVLRGDLVRVSHYRIERGTSWGRVLEVPASDRLVVSRPCVMETGGSYSLRIRQADGDQLGTTVFTAPGEQVALRTTSNHAASVGDLFAFGNLNEESELCVVLKVTHSDDLTAALVVTPAGTAESATGNGDALPGAISSTFDSPSWDSVSGAGGFTIRGIG